MGDTVDGRRQWVAGCGDQPGGEGAGPFHGHLLPEHCSGQQLNAVGVPRRAEPGPLADERPENWIIAELGIDGVGIRIQVEQPAAALNCRLGIGDVVEVEGARHRVGSRCACAGRQGDHGISVVETQRAAIGRAIPRLDAGHGSVAQEPEDRLAVERGAVREAQRQRAGRGARPAGPAEIGGRRGEHLPDGVVELAHAGKPGGKGDLGDRHRRGLDQRAGRLGALGPSQRQRTGTQLAGQQPIDLTLAVVQPRGKATDPLAIHEPIGDQPHRPSDHVNAYVPLRRPGRRIGAAPLARPVSVLLGGRCGHEELDVVALRGHCRAARPAVDAGGLHRRDEAAIEAAVATLRGAVALFVVEDHAAIVVRDPPTD